MRAAVDEQRRRSACRTACRSVEHRRAKNCIPVMAMISRSTISAPVVLGRRCQAHEPDADEAQASTMPRYGIARPPAAAGRVRLAARITTSDDEDGDAAAEWPSDRRLSSLLRHALTHRERASDHEALDLARALVDLGDPRRGRTLRRGLLGVAVAAEDLDRLAGLRRATRTRTARLRALDAVRRPACLTGRAQSNARAASIWVCMSASFAGSPAAAIGPPNALRSLRSFASSNAAWAMPTAWAAIRSGRRRASQRDRMPPPGSPAGRRACPRTRGRRWRRSSGRSSPPRA